MDLIKKISVKTVCQEKARKLLGTLKECLVMQIFGYISEINHPVSKFQKDGYKEGVDEPETNIELCGTFEAWAANNNRKYRSSRCYLPDVISESLEVEFKRAKALNFPEFSFAIQVWVVEDESEIGFHYIGRSLMPMEGEGDPIMKLQKQVKDYQSALPAPEKPAEAGRPVPLSPEEQINEWQP